MNRAAELGPAHIRWWQDWRGECVAIIASGPSVSKEQVELLRDRIHVIAIKNNVELVPWAEVVYGCDGPWWKHHNGLPNYSGIKLCHDGGMCTRFGLHKVEIKHIDKLLTDEPGTIGSGGNSGFQAINIAAQFGATGILLIGYDMQANGKVHWYGRNIIKGMNNPGESNFKRWKLGFDAVAPTLSNLGIDVVNASPQSALKCFRYASVEAALSGWGL